MGWESNVPGLLNMYAKLLAVGWLFGKRDGSGHGSKRVWVETSSGQTGSMKKGLFWSGSKRVRVGTGSGQNGFRVGSGWLKNVFLKVIVHEGPILSGE
ncbi:hypothetical protein Hanom_Chr00s036214g01772401 [Helianthus anomalus]